MAKNPSSFSHQLISDERIVKWSHRTLVALQQYLEETLSKDAAQIPNHTLAKLKAIRAQLVTEAESEAIKKSNQVHYNVLQHLQEARAKALCKFKAWKTDTLFPEFQAKEEAARTDKLKELDIAKHAFAIEAEEAKEMARLVTAQSVVHAKSDSHQAG